MLVGIYNSSNQKIVNLIHQLCIKLDIKAFCCVPMKCQWGPTIASPSMVLSESLGVIVATCPLLAKSFMHVQDKNQNFLLVRKNNRTMLNDTSYNFFFHKVGWMVIFNMNGEATILDYQVSKHKQFWKVGIVKNICYFVRNIDIWRYKPWRRNHKMGN